MYSAFYRRLSDLDFSIDLAFYILLITRVVVTGAGMYIQYKIYKKDYQLELAGLLGKKINFLPDDLLNHEPWSDAENNNETNEKQLIEHVVDPEKPVKMPQNYTEDD